VKRLLGIFTRLSALDLAVLELQDAERQYLLACTHTEDWEARKRTLEVRIKRLRAATQTRKEQSK
jgi:hypothetical protein